MMLIGINQSNKHNINLSTFHAERLVLSSHAREPLCKQNRVLLTDQ